MQLRELREYCQRRGWEIVGEYVDTGWSGSKTERPALKRCMAAARKRQIDCVVVWKLDRWGRTMLHAIESIQDLAAHGVRWVAITQGLDTHQTNPMARAMLGMLAVFAEFERDILRERVKAGIAQARQEGKRHGRPPTAARLAGQARDLFQQGSSKREIATRLGISRTSVRRLLASTRDGSGRAFAEAEETFYCGAV